MKTVKRKKLEAAGWRIGDTSEFLGLSEAESAYIETKLQLAERLEQARKEHHLTQKKLAAMLKTSQSRLAGAGEEIRTLDPHLGKVVPGFRYVLRIKMLWKHRKASYPFSYRFSYRKF